MKSDQKYFQSINNWGEWLAQNHSSEEVVWLVCYKKHSKKPTLDYAESVEEALCYGWIDSLVKRVDDERFMRKFTPRRKGSVWSPSNLERIKKLQKEKRLKPAGLESIKGIDIDAQGHIPPAEKVVLGEIPPFIFKALEINPDVLKKFQLLSPSQKKQYLGWILFAKKEDTRLKRLGEMVEKLKQGKTLGLK